jgi:hypothetical protein
MKLICCLNIKLHHAEKGQGITQNSKAETEICEIKTKWKARIQEAQIPSRLWDYGLVYVAEVQSLLARGPLQHSGLELISGQTPDISEWLNFYFYDRVWYWDQKKTDMNDEQACIGCWLGIAHHIGSDMMYWILTEAGNVIARSTVQHITMMDMATNAIKTRVITFDYNLLTQLCDKNFQIELPNLVFYLQDEDADMELNDTHDIPLDAEYMDMIQPPKSDAKDIEYKLLTGRLALNSW